MESAPPLEHAARFGRGGLRRRVMRRLLVGKIKDRVGPICQQDDGSEQPTPVKAAEIGNEPEDPAHDREARLHDVAPFIRWLPLGEEGAIVKLKARWLLGDVDVGRGSGEEGRCRERKLSSQHFATELTAAPHLNGKSDSTFGRWVTAA